MNPVVFDTRMYKNSVLKDMGYYDFNINSRIKFIRMIPLAQFDQYLRQLSIN